MRRDDLGTGEAPPVPSLTLAAGGLRIDLLDRSVMQGARAIRLSPREFSLLALIVHAAPLAVSRHEVRRRVLACRHDPGTNAVEVHLSRLRAKLREAGAPSIETVAGPAYRLTLE